MSHFDFAKYWHMRHVSKPDVKKMSVEELIALTNIPEWIVNTDSEVLTKEGANNPNLATPIAPGEVIVKALNHFKMTQSELAHNLNVSRAFMTMIIHGDRPISLEHALIIEEVLNIPAHVLLRLQADHEIYRHYCQAIEEH